MKTYNYSETYPNLSMIFDISLNKDIVNTKKDSKKTEIISANKKRTISPLDVEGINTSITTQDIINMIKVGRKTYPRGIK